MLSLKTHNLDIIRDFSEEQFLSHIKITEEIRAENDFGDIGISTLLDNYIILFQGIHKDHKEAQKTEFVLSKNEVLLFDLVADITRLCYKYSYNTSTQNDWEEEFS